MTKLHISPTPHIHEAGSSTRRIMLDVIIALLPAAVAGIIIFGLGALWTILVCIASAVLAEFLFNLIARKEQTVGDLSAVVTGLLLALNLSTNVPLPECALGSVFAMVVVKGFFGGIGKNLVNPAIAARVFLLLAFTSKVAGGANPVGVELTSSATPLVTINQGAEAAKAKFFPEKPPSKCESSDASKISASSPAPVRSNRVSAPSAKLTASSVPSAFRAKIESCGSARRSFTTTPCLPVPKVTTRRSKPSPAL